MQFVSTRGQAPAVSFSDAVLTGLAPDGGLYMPETWPQIDAAEIERFADSALRRDRRASSSQLPRAARFPADLREHHRRGLRDLPPSLGVAARRDRPAPLRPRAVPRPDAELQGRRDAVPGAHDGRASSSQRGKRATIVGATSGDTGSAAIEAFRGRDNIDIFILHPKGRTSEDAAPADDDGARRQRPQHRARGHLRRLPGHR